MIKSKKDKKERRIEMDLTGPEGNAFAIMGVAQQLSRSLGYNTEKILAEMQSGDYEHLIDVMEQYFGDYVIMYR